MTKNTQTLITMMRSLIKVQAKQKSLLKTSLRMMVSMMITHMLLLKKMTIMTKIMKMKGRMTLREIAPHMMREFLMMILMPKL